MGIYLFYGDFCDLFNDAVNNTDPDMTSTDWILKRITGKEKIGKELVESHFWRDWLQP
jgi:hypothetical protein